MRAALALSLAFAMVLVTYAPVAAADAAPKPAPTFGPQDMWASLSGWGFSSATISNPGPTITVTPGELVQLRLFSEDGFPHQWVLDLNGNTFFDTGEPASAIFGSPSAATPFNFNAPSVPANLWYMCGIHGWNLQRGQFIIAGNAPPTVTLTNPDGTTQNRWSGGSTQRLTWTMADPDGLPSQLAVWLNYTFNAGANSGPIAGPPTLPLGATFFDWTVPLANANDMRVHIDVVDPGGGKGTDARLVPVVDSTPPTVTGVTPTNGATGVSPATWLNITFSEAMNQASAQGAVSLCRMPGCVNVPLTFVGWTANTLTMRPTSTLAGSAQYQGTVSTAARDASSPGNPMAGPSVWTFQTANSPPVLTPIDPNANTRWTGGSAQTIRWTLTDAEDPATSLTVFINYSPTGGPPWTSVAGPLRGDVTSSPFTVPMDDSTNARIQWVANDTGGAVVMVVSVPFVVDSTPPNVLSTSPADGATGVALGANVLVTFSEAMNTAVTGAPATVGLQNVGSGAWVPVTYLWNPQATVLTVDPVAPLAPSTQYRLFVNATARDNADPGLPMGLPFTMSFTTGALVDTTPPTITNVAATPPSEIAGGTVEVSADVTDDTGLMSVSVEITLPDTTTRNETMLAGAGDRYAFSDAWTQVGTHAFRIWASDTSGNWASASGSFTITGTVLDSEPPQIVHTPPTGTIRVGDAIRIEATVTDNVGVQTVRIDWTDVSGARLNVTMTLTGGVYVYTIPAQAATGTVTYHIYAVDTAGNGNRTQTFTLAISAAGGPPGGGVDAGLLAGLAILVAAALVALFLLLRRRRGKEPTEAPLPESEGLPGDPPRSLP